MPRSARKKGKTGVYHIITRGINRQEIFQDDEDKNVYLDRLCRYKNECLYEVYAYCLMSNHIHLLIKEGEESISGIMKKIGASYVYWYNRKYDRVGHLFQDRYKSETIENDAQLLVTTRYILQNPVKIGLKIEEWTSYTDYLRGSGVTDTGLVMGILGNSKKEQMKEFISYMNDVDTNKYLEYENQNRMTDKNAKQKIMEIGKVQHCQELQNFDRQKRDYVIRKLRDEGITIRQLERLTGISRGRIQKTLLGDREYNG